MGRIEPLVRRPLDSTGIFVANRSMHHAPCVIVLHTMNHRTPFRSGVFEFEPHRSRDFNSSRLLGLNRHEDRSWLLRGLTRIILLHDIVTTSPFFFIPSTLILPLKRVEIKAGVLKPAVQRKFLNPHYSLADLSSWTVSSSAEASSVACSGVSWESKLSSFSIRRFCISSSST